ncbi:MAG TPA: hypothetical protein DCX25_00570 [Candidatus Pacebacteria bacterium]|nr:MAG: hypothetical protein UX00_C0003G0099 [Microgenomates group bacterium GW2011_GWB1_45_17]KKU22944.1 MAG: hypothetical protein UX35_C0013G0021 [Microgenomates group bacterium GW2011_GWA1_46_15]KKU24096.1 MAG: hypothetical protein UX36_C0002G0079 [Microgenomates group bacterium GW2011_GWC1_46_15]HAV14815.1 hypothetical protein [Candidatus Paceibacterota bacterium]HCR11206.1 hypothetical protein [Candidatus Paceibacterota bacterium]
MTVEDAERFALEQAAIESEEKRRDADLFLLLLRGAERVKSLSLTPRVFEQYLKKLLRNTDPKKGSQWGITSYEELPIPHTQDLKKEYAIFFELSDRPYMVWVQRDLYKRNRKIIYYPDIKPS